MGKPVDPNIKAAEAAALNALLESRGYGEGKHAEFARMADIKGGRSMVFQHVKGLKPISIFAAKRYAIGLNCSIREFSERLANLVDEPQTYPQVANVRYLAAEPGRVEQLINELTSIARGITERGLIELIGRAKELAMHHGLESKNAAR